MHRTEIDMTSRKGMLKNLIRFVTPLMLSGILQLLFTASDLIVCRFFGSEHSVGAISSTSALINLIVNLFMGLSVGANILMSRCYGADDREGGQRVVYTSVILSAVLGLVLGVFGFFCSGVFLRWMGTNEDLIELSTQYLAIYFLGIPFTMVYNFCAALLRAVGDTQKPFWFLTISGVVNVLLNLLLVIVFRLDVAGVSIASAVAQFLAAAMVFVYICRKKSGFFEFRFRKMKFSLKEAVDITRIGFPAGLQGAIFSVSNVLIQVGVNDLSVLSGPAIVDGNGASSSLEGFVYTAMNSCSQAIVSFGSANYGAGKKENIKRVILLDSLLVAFVCIVPSLLMILFRDPLLHIYVSTEDAIAYGSERTVIVMSLYLFCGFMEVFAYSLRSIGYSVLPTVVTAVGACGFRVFWIYCIFPIEGFHNLFWLSASYPISWFLTAATHFVLFAVLYRRLRLPPKGEAGLNEAPAERSSRDGTLPAAS